MESLFEFVWEVRGGGLSWSWYEQRRMGDAVLLMLGGPSSPIAHGARSGVPPVTRSKYQTDHVGDRLIGGSRSLRVVVRTRERDPVWPERRDTKTWVMTTANQLRNSSITIVR